MFLRRPVFNVRYLSSLVKNMETHQVVPDVIDTPPKELAEVITYLFFFLYTDLLI